MEWISVSKKLPMDGKPVLIFEKYNDCGIGVAIYNTMYSAWVPSFEFVSSSHGILENLLNQKLVTHWMPLPAPPKD